MKTVALMCVYNEVMHIMRAIESIYPYVDEIRIFDGAYATYDVVHPQSNDGMLTVLKAACLPKLTVYETKDFWPSQIAKRSAMLATIKEDEAFIILDGDEEVYLGDVIEDFVESDALVGWVQINSPLYDAPYMTPRMFKYIEGMHYKGRHHYIFDGDNKLIASHQRMANQIQYIDSELKIYNLRHNVQGGISRDRKKRNFSINRNQSEMNFKDELDVYGEAPSKSFLHPLRAGQPCKQFTTVIEPQYPLQTLILPVTRMWAISSWLDTFKNVEISWQETELLVIFDSDHATSYRRLVNMLTMFARANNINGFKILMTGKRAEQDNSSIHRRRKRICKNLYRFVTEASGDIILGAEDDTLPDIDAYRKLTQVLMHTGAAFVQGTELGRWSLRLVPHWRMDNVHDPAYISTAIRGEDNLVEIHGAGWYCFAARTQVIRSINIDYDHDLPVGPDVQWVMNLTRMGFSCYGMWDVECAHITQRDFLHPNKDNIDTLEWSKIDGKWQQIIKRNVCLAPHKIDNNNNVRVVKPLEKHDMSKIAMVANITFRGMPTELTRPGQPLIGKGQTFYAQNAARASQLENRKIATRLPNQPKEEKETAVVGPTETKVVAPETKEKGGVRFLNKEGKAFNDLEEMRASNNDEAPKTISTRAKVSEEDKTVVTKSPRRSQGTK